MAATSSAATPAAVGPAPGAVPDSALTVGEFLVMYAGGIRLELPPSAGGETALLALKAAKAIPGEDFALDRPLTHKDVLKIARARGLKVSSSTPDRALSRAEAQLFLDTYSKVLSVPPSDERQDGGGTTVVDASENPPSEPPGHANVSKGKKKGRPFQSPTEP